MGEGKKISFDRTIRLDFLVYVILTALAAVGGFYMLKERVSLLEAWKVNHMEWSDEVKSNIDRQLQEIKEAVRADRDENRSSFRQLNDRFDKWERELYKKKDRE